MYYFAPKKKKNIYIPRAVVEVKKPNVYTIKYTRLFCV